MRIVFWGSERGCGTTSNMLLLASFLACRKGYRIALVELSEGKRGIRSCFPLAEENYSETYIHTLVKRQLYYVCLEEWKKQKSSTSIQLIKHLESNMDMVFVDLANCLSEEAKELMHNANLVVVNLKQQRESFERYCAQYANLSARMFLLVGNYYPDRDCVQSYLQRKYKIPEKQLGVIPHNPEFEIACSKHRLDRYIRRKRFTRMTEIKRLFFREMKKTAELFYEALFYHGE